jgi:DNA replication protein DnaC
LAISNEEVDPVQQLASLMDATLVAASTASSSENRIVCVTCGKEAVRGDRPFWLRGPDDECESCLATRLAVQQAQEEAEAELQLQKRNERERHEQVRQCLRAGGPGRRYARATWESFREEEHNRAAREVVEHWLRLDERPNLIISGPVGAGKTFLAASLYHDLTGPERLVPCLWLAVAPLLQEVKRGFRDDDIRRRTEELIDLSKTVPVLFLDDLGKNHGRADSSWMEEQLYEIVDARYREELPTILTTEWTSSMLETKVGQSVVSRLVDDALVAGVRVPKTPYRRLRQEP